MASRSLFDWADEQAAKVVDFRGRREHLARWRWMQQHQPFAHLDRVIDRQDGRIPPAPILGFPGRHPTSPGVYSPDPIARVQR